MRPLLILLLFPAVASADPARRDLYGDPLPEGAIQRLGTARMKHLGADYIQVAPDGKTILTSAYGDNSPRVWSAETGKLLKAIKKPGNRPSNTHYSDDGLRAMQNRLGGIQVWEVESNRLLHNIQAAKGEFFTQPALRGDGKSVAAIDRGVWVWDLEAGTRKELPGRFKSVQSIYFCPGGRLLVAERVDEGEFRSSLWDLGRNERLHSFAGFPHPFPTNCGKAIAIRRDASGKAISEIWDLETLERTHTLVHGPTAHDVTPSPDGTLVFDENEVVGELRELKSGRKIAEINRPWAFAFSSDSRFAYAVANGGKLSKRDVKTGQVLWEARDSGTAPPLDVRWTPDSRTLFVTRDQEADAVGIFDVGSGTEVERFDLSKRHGRPLPPLTAPSEVGLRLLTVSPSTEGFQQHLWVDGRLGKPVEMPLSVPKPSPPRAYAITPDGARLRLFHHFRGATSSDGVKYREIDPTTGKVTRSRVEDAHDAGALRFSSDGRFYYDFKVARVSDTGESLPPLTPLPSPYRLHFSSRGYFLGGSRQRAIPEGERTPPKFHPDQSVLTVWDRLTGQSVLEVPDLAESGMAFDPFERFVAMAQQKEITVLDLASGEVVKSIANPVSTLVDAAPMSATCLAFSPDGKRLATGHSDTTVLIWDLSDLPALPREKLDPPALETLWAALREPDAKAAHAAIGKLAGSPETVLPFLKNRLRPVEAIPQETVDPLVKQLRSDNFRQRETATKKLGELGDGLLPFLDELLKGDPSDDLRKRASSLREPHTWKVPPTGEDLRLLRAVRLLETLGGPEALKLVESLAGGVPAARATQEAVAARERMRHGPAPGPNP